MVVASDQALPRLSKSRVLSGWQCPLRLWNEIHHRDQASAWTETQQAIFNRGTLIGALARRRWPKGVLVGFDPWEREPAIEETERLMADSSVPAIYEAAFQYRGVFVRVDVLVRHDDGWELVEVKASTRPEKEVFQKDVAVQHWVLRGAGVRVMQAGVLVLDRDYVHPGGGAYDLDALFRLGDAADDIERYRPEIESLVAEFHDMLSRENPPQVAIGDQCSTPYPCPFFDNCSQGLVWPENPVTDLYRLRASQREELAGAGIEEIAEIPDDFELSAVQQRIRSAVISGRVWCSPELGRVMDEVEWPLAYLDFEAFAPALPLFQGTRPFEAIPFQFSVHQELDDGSLVHREYLHPEATDPRRALAQALLDALGDRGSIIVYSSYERRIINALAAELPDLSESLLALNERLWDLLPVVREHVYHPDFHGSYSIKSVLPAMTSGSGWDELAISDGQTAALLYQQAIEDIYISRPDGVFQDLREYCAQDTLAMVELRQALVKLAVSNNH